jgi:hypothetical protein
MDPYDSQPDHPLSPQRILGALRAALEESPRLVGIELTHGVPDTFDITGHHPDSLLWVDYCPDRYQGLLIIYNAQEARLEVNTVLDRTWVGPVIKQIELASPETDIVGELLDVIEKYQPPSDLAGPPPSS